MGTYPSNQPSNRNPSNQTSSGQENPLVDSAMPEGPPPLEIFRPLQMSVVEKFGGTRDGQVYSVGLIAPKGIYTARVCYMGPASKPLESEITNMLGNFPVQFESGKTEDGVARGGNEWGRHQREKRGGSKQP